MTFLFLLACTGAAVLAVLHHFNRSEPHMLTRRGERLRTVAYWLLGFLVVIIASAGVGT